MVAAFPRTTPYCTTYYTIPYRKLSDNLTKIKPLNWGCARKIRVYAAELWRQDARVTLFERTNIRTAAPGELGAPFDLIVADLSFIGLASLAPVFARLAHPGSVFIGLVKPQFESRHEETDERGVVRDASVRARTVDEVVSALAESGFAGAQVIESPIAGKRSGNVEYLVRAIMQ